MTVGDKSITLKNRFHSSSGHRQLSIDGLLAELRKLIPQDALCLMALTMSDLYDTAPDLFVAGMAAGNRRVGVFSFFRYDPARAFSCEFWHEVRPVAVDTAQRRALIFARCCKLLVHEILHILGNAPLFAGISTGYVPL